MMKLKTYTGEEVKAIRKKLRITQSDFWAALWVAQPRGSRYESGRDIPDSVQVLLNLALGPEKKATEILERMRALGEKGGEGR